MIDPTAKVTGTTKVTAVSDNVKKIYSESSAVKGTQFIFMDRFQDRTGKFNMFEEIKKELISIKKARDEKRSWKSMNF